MKNISRLTIIMKLIYILCFVSDRYFYYRDSFVILKQSGDKTIAPENSIKLNGSYVDIYFKTQTLISSPHPILFLLNDYSELVQGDASKIQNQIYFCIAYDFFIGILCVISIFKNNSRIIWLLFIFDSSIKIYTIWNVEFNNKIQSVASQKDIRRFLQIFIQGVFSDNLKEIFSVIMLAICELKTMIINFIAIIIILYIKIIDIIIWEDDEYKLNIAKKKVQ